MKKINYLLGYDNLKIYQDDEKFKFSLDSVLLANFVSITKKTKRILDIGCGNAPISLILTTRTKALIDGVEIQNEISEMAIDSIKYNQLEGQIKIYNDDINNYYKNVESDFYDTIVCNPPYFKVSHNSFYNKNECKTIARHEIYLTLENIFLIAKKILKNNGVISIVHRPERLCEILVMMKKYNIEPKKIQFVYPKINKEANIVLIEGVKNGSCGIKFLPPLFIYDENNKYTKEVLQYFERR